MKDSAHVLSLVVDGRRLEGADTISYEISVEGKSVEIRQDRNVDFLLESAKSLRFDTVSKVIWVGPNCAAVQSLNSQIHKEAVVVEPLQLVVFAAEMVSGLIVRVDDAVELFEVKEQEFHTQITTKANVSRKSRAGMIAQVLVEEPFNLSLKFELTDFEPAGDEDVVVEWFRVDRRSDDLRLWLFDKFRQDEFCARFFDAGVIRHEALRFEAGEMGTSILAWMNQRTAFETFLGSSDCACLRDLVSGLKARDSCTIGALSAGFRMMRAVGLLGEVGRLSHEHQVSSLRLAFASGGYASALRTRILLSADERFELPLRRVRERERSIADLKGAIPLPDEGLTLYDSFPLQDVSSEAQIRNSCWILAACAVLKWLIATGQAQVIPAHVGPLLAALEDLAEADAETPGLAEQTRATLELVEAFVAEASEAIWLAPAVMNLVAFRDAVVKFRSSSEMPVVARKLATGYVKARDKLLEVVRLIAQRSGNIRWSEPGRLRTDLAVLRGRIASKREEAREELLCASARKIINEIEKLLGKHSGDLRRVKGTVKDLLRRLERVMRGMNVVRVPGIDVRGLARVLGPLRAWELIVSDAGGNAAGCLAEGLRGSRFGGWDAVIMPVPMSEEALAGIDMLACGALLVTFGQDLPRAIERTRGDPPRWRALPGWTADATVYRSDDFPRVMRIGGGTGGPLGHAACVLGINRDAEGRRVLRVEDTGEVQVYDLPVSELLALKGAALWMVPAGQRVLRCSFSVSTVARGDALWEARSDFSAFAGRERWEVEADAEALRRLDDFVPVLE